MLYHIFKHWEWSWQCAADYFWRNSSCFEMWCILSQTEKQTETENCKKIYADLNPISKSPSRLFCPFIIWLALWAGKMNQIPGCDWLPERARWSYLARSGLPAMSRKKNFPESHTINPLLTKLVRSRWLDIGLVLFLRAYGPRLRLGP